VPLVVVALCAVIYRGRAQVRPETVAAVLLTAEIWLLESRRHGARIPPAWLVLIAWVWANTHISYYLFFVVLGIHVLASLLPPRRAGAPPLRELWLTGWAAAAVSFLNPSGWRTVWQPFEFWLVWRHEPIYQNIHELMPVDWSANWKNGLPLLMAAWPVLALRRARRPALDPVECMTCAVFSALVLLGQRFMGVYALAAAVYVSRDLDEVVRARPRPVWLPATWTRAGLAAAACVLVALPDLARRAVPIRVHFPANRFPVAACDFIEAHGLRGRFYNPYGLGGYLCFRFWPQRDRLPFMGIHQEGTKEIRALYMAALASPESWRALDERFRFDLLLLYRNLTSSDELLPAVDADSTWARVFSDDVAHVFIRRAGTFARLARDSAYEAIPADPRRVAGLGERAGTDSVLLGRAERELWREVASSPYHAQALGMLANIAYAQRR